MILSDGTIRRRIETANVGVRPEPTESQYQPASLDLRLGAEYYDVYADTYREDDEGVLIRPASFYLGTTQETITLPDDLAAQVTGRSSFGREGIIIHATAGWLDPGWSGEVTLEIYNLGNRPVVLQPGDRVCQLIFYPLDNPAEVPYDQQDGSKYQHQSGPTPSRRDDSEGS